MRLAAASIVTGSLLLAAAGGSAAAPKPRVQLTVGVVGSGLAHSVPKGIRCKPACRARFRSGTRVVLTATPAAGWALSRWTGACKGEAPRCVVRMTGAKRVSAVFVRAAAPPAAGGFTPQTLAGTWAGTWRNTRFGSSGPASFEVRAPDASSFTFTATLGGNVFGCPAPPPTSGTITAGTGPNRWNANGFAVELTAGGGGRVTVAYDHASRTLTASGTSGCAPGISWTMRGAFSGDAFTGTVTITLPDTSTAISVLELARR